MLQSVKDVWRKIDGWYFRKGNPHGPKDFSFFQKHHFFYGIILWLIAFFLEMTTDCPCWVTNTMLYIGTWIGFDDYFQHQRQADELEENGEYTTKSFWHWVIYDYIWPGLKALARSVGVLSR